jgi:hypothetical protein
VSTSSAWGAAMIWAVSTARDEVARIDRIEVLVGEQLGGAASLSASALVERDVHLPHDAQLRVPIGLAVTD